jgi:ribosomal protein L37E
MTEIVREFHCPACRATVSAFPDEVGQTVLCGYCHERFELMDTPTLPPVAQPVTPPLAIRRFTFQCQRCGSVLEGKSDLSGRQGQCPTCAALFTIPEVHPVTGLPLGHGAGDSDSANPTPMHAYAAAGDKAPRILRGENGEIHIHCPRCSGRSDIDADNCAECGLPFTVEGASFKSVSSANTLAMASLVLGLIAVLTSLYLVGGLIGVIAIGFGLQARRQVSISQSGQDRGNRIGFAGIGLGIVALLIALASYRGGF